MSRGASFNQLIVDLGMENKVPFTTEEIVNSSPELQNNYQPGIVRRGLALVAIGATLAGFGYGNSNEKKSDVLPNVTNEQVDPNSSSNGEVAMCEDTWAVRELDNTGHRVVGSGSESIMNASTAEEAKNAAYDFLEVTKSDPDVVKANAELFLGEKVDVSSLQKDGCMTDKAVLIVNSVAKKFENSVITPAQAPANVFNSGINSKGELVFANNPGVKGNRKSIKIELGPGGDDEEITTVYVKANCGNPLIPVEEKSKVDIPTGPTDNENPELPPSTTTYVPTTTSTTTSKETTTSTPSTTRWESTTTIKGTTTTIKGTTTTVVSPSTSRPTPTTSRPKNTIPEKLNNKPAPGRNDVPADQDNGISDKYGEGEAGQDRDSKGYIPTETRPPAPTTTRRVEQAPTTTWRPPAITAKPPVVTSPPRPVTTTVNTTKPQTGQRPVQP